MKKAIVLTLAAFFFLSAFLWFPQPSSARPSADACYDGWDRCRQRSFYADEGWVRTALMLSVCDVALGKCLIIG